MDYKFKNSLKTAKIVIPYAELKEGTPISISGAVTNGSGAFGIVKKLGDKFVGNGGFFCEAEVIVAGYLDENECEKACGLTYTDNLKSALANIVFVDEFLPETPDELPTVGVGDTGKVLTVGDGGEPEWAEVESDDPYAGYDIVVKADAFETLNTLTDTDIHLVKGSYADAISKVKQGLPLFSYVYGIFATDEAIFFHEFPLVTTLADEGYIDAVTLKVFNDTLPAASVRNSANNDVAYIQGAAIGDNTVDIYITESGITFIPPWE